MKIEAHKTIYLKDYRPYPYAVESIDLSFDLREGKTTVTAKTLFKVKGKQEPLFLNGEDLTLKSIRLDGKELDSKDYSLDEKSLTIHAPPTSFELETVTEIDPENNTRLEGLYKSGGNYCTQCEAEGFRRISYFPDRPDVMTVYTVRIEADKEKYPVLLSNGNLMERGLCSTPPHPALPPMGEGEKREALKARGQEGQRHFAVWHDPFPKPCYLFALVAGNLAHIRDTYKTKSNRKVNLFIYVRHGDEDQCAHAMESLKKSMKWDEDVYGLEYDLDIFNIVAVSDFNMGAMENKSLNIFNTALVLARQDTATDGDFERIESVIAHEYFHNWSGDRVTCRDWFQLSLKEGLTVFRDQEFSADMHSRAVKRIDDVVRLRRMQFPEVSGPLAHPIRPDNYIEINNFYTMTVYEKGAEVIRMMRTILGPENYRKGTDLYFSRHDGQAVTCEDFIKCMEDASGVDLKQFRLWYEQAGTPEVTFDGKYDASARTYTVNLSQKIPATPGQPVKKPMHIPVAMGLVSDNGDDVDMKGSSVIHLTEAKQTFTFENIASKPVPSVLRGFSAPVKLKTNLSDDELAFLMVHDSDGFNRWEAGQAYMLRVLNKMIDEGSGPPASFLKVYAGLLERALDPSADKALMARAISLPDISLIAQEREVVDPQAIYEAREKLLNAIVAEFSGQLDRIYANNRSGKDFSISAEAMGRRVLQNTTMLIRANKLTPADAARIQAHYDESNNMTDRIAALYLACALDGPAHENILSDFFERFKSYPLVIDKWFAAQAQVTLPKTMDVVKKLRRHPDFNIKNPNRARALFASFAMNNPVRFHAADGSGYEFLTEAVIELNAINPQIAARLLTPMREWRRYTQDRQEKMKDCLQRILKTPKISPDVYEIASKSLDNSS